MIVRIFSEGQFRLDDAHHSEIDKLDDAIVAAVETGEEARFRASFEELLQFVRAKGRELSDSDLEISDVILPPADITLAEARRNFTGEGLLPD